MKQTSCLSGATRIDPSCLHTLDDTSFRHHEKGLLCDDSDGDVLPELLSWPEFRPDTFTLADRFLDPPYLHPDDRDMHVLVRGEVTAILRAARAEGIIDFGDHEPLVDFIEAQFLAFLAESTGHGTVAEEVYNQEFPDVLRNVVAYCLFGSPHVELHVFRSFNAHAAPILPLILERLLKREVSGKELLLHSIYAGLIGLDIKGAAAAASSFSHQGIPLTPYLSESPDKAADGLYEHLSAHASAGLEVDHWDRLMERLKTTARTRLAWFPDDFIETYLDLGLLSRLLQDFPNLTVCLVPRNGQYGNDASYKDVFDMMKACPSLQLERHVASGRLQISTHGPRMGAVNLRKLSPTAQGELAACDCVHVKGCRAYEMLQGGLNREMFTSFVTVRDFTERETGLDARRTPALFLRTAPGEYSYWGFKGSAKRRTCSAPDREIPTCLRTVLEGQKYQMGEDCHAIVEELGRLSGLFETEGPEHERPCGLDLATLMNRLTAQTAATYDRVCEEYRTARRQDLDSDTVADLNRLLEMAREKASRREMDAGSKRLSLLDIGTADGRDLIYLTRFGDVKAVGIENSDGFLRMLADAERQGVLPAESYFKMDMRCMTAFPQDSFDIVRHNATLLHMPVLPNGIGADEALAETFRVLKPGGLTYILVKQGSGMACEDTGEGLGFRFNQYYDVELLTRVLARNGFRVLEISGSRTSQRPVGTLKWLTCYAEKPDASCPTVP